MTKPDHTCIRNNQVVCFDDLCHGVDGTLCGAVEGIDFNLFQSEDDYEPEGYDDETS